MPRKPLFFLTLAGSLALLGGCPAHDDAHDDDHDDDDAGDSAPGQGCEDDDDGLVRPDGWTAATHCAGAAPNYDLVFDDAVVHRIDITMSADDYEASLDDLADLVGGAGPGGGGGDLAEEPMWVPVAVELDGVAWWEVGMRYKGNSSLRSAYREGVLKIPFRLNFDKYEDDFPELDDQRFHGFKKMTFSSAFRDDSLIRDKVGADIFRAAGVPAARGAFARVYVDHGDGPTYFGLYTMIEDVSNKMLETQFDDDGGNLYKPDGRGARLGSFDADSMHKKTHEAEADFSDVQELIDVLNGDRSDAADWRERLESVIDVQGFLRVLAVNQAMVNWDSYGWMNHNFYLYADPSDGGRFAWIPWDLNECMLLPPGGPGGGDRSFDSVLLQEIRADWPMIRHVLDDPVYSADYRAHLAEVLDGAFALDAVQDRLRRHHELIAPYVVGPDGESAPYTNLRDASAFENALSGPGGLLEHVEIRRDDVEDALVR